MLRIVYYKRYFASQWVRTVGHCVLMGWCSGHTATLGRLVVCNVYVLILSRALRIRSALLPRCRQFCLCALFVRHKIQNYTNYSGDACQRFRTNFRGFARLSTLKKSRLFYEVRNYCLLENLFGARLHESYEEIAFDVCQVSNWFSFQGYLNSERKHRVGCWIQGVSLIGFDMVLWQQAALQFFVDANRAEYSRESGRHVIKAMHRLWQWQHDNGNPIVVVISSDSRATRMDWVCKKMARVCWIALTVIKFYSTFCWTSPAAWREHQGAFCCVFLTFTENAISLSVKFGAIGSIRVDCRTVAQMPLNVPRLYPME